ncbi:shikimate dehydrogenase family protein [Anaeromyxobacter paludicola]|uniref:Shikimate dehydrogenase (NADP(+)) n=1 Tax=Anaeromyxobacter paludicola TaxID=2918171 RepID=A0ABM7XCF5_9BACT|nr:shikimate dehydrogenase (NADP+) [Anaeromyxobacter paludicola]BDG09553.1 shikimate dehydrogenase (NADP(+)) [Anaeromyxobacter paludicola]
MISGRTTLYGVVGWPVAHSRSPAMQNAAFAALGLDAAYVALPAEPARIEEALRGAFALGFQGLNVTVPHKQDALAAAASADEVARAVGAANTLKRGPSGWEAANTDAPACVSLLAGAGVKPGQRALLLGAGGAARAALWALRQLGLEVAVAARREEKARELAAVPPAPAAGAGTGGGAPVSVLPWAEARHDSESFDAVVNGTSIGLHEKTTCPVPLRSGQVVLDFVYGDTPFARAARDAGAAFVSGEEVLLRQGALALEIWTGRPAPEAAMRAALNGAP